MAVDPDVILVTDALETRIADLETTVSALQNTVAQIIAAPEVHSAMLEFNAALSTRLASLTPAEQVALLDALALNAEQATITPA